MSLERKIRKTRFHNIFIVIFKVALLMNNALQIFKERNKSSKFQIFNSGRCVFSACACDVPRK